MAELQQQLIWLGAGTARQPNLNFNTFSQITLVEAREDACNALQQAYKQPNITVLQQLVSAEAASHNFTSYNLAEFSAIRPIAGLKVLFPGLKTKSQERLQSQAVNVLIDQINTNQPLQPEANTLIIDIPDQAHSLLSKLIQTKQLALFNTLVIPYGAELYADMADVAVITELLEKQNFVLQSTDNSDPDLPRYSFKLDAAAKRIAHLNHKVKQLTEQLAAAQQSEADTRQQLEQQKAELSKQLDAAKQQASSDKQQLEQQKAELSKQLEAAKQQASTDKQQLEQQKVELSKQLDAAKQQASSDKQQLEQQKAELSKQLEAAKQQASTDKQQLEQQKAELTKQLEAAKQQASADKQQLEQQKAELSKQLESAKQQASADKQQLEQQKAELTKQLEAAKQQASADKQQLEQQKAELSKQLEAAKQQASADKQQLEQQKAELTKQLEAAKQHAATEKQQSEQQKAELNKQLESAQQQASADKQQLEQQKAELNKQLEAAKQQASADKQQLEQQKAELTKQLEAAKQLAATEKQQSEQQKAELNKQLEQQKAELNKQLEAAKQQASADKQQLERQKAELTKQLEHSNKKSKFSSNANIDDFIDDIEPFFLNKKLTFVDVGAYVGEILEKITSENKLTIREAHMYEPNPESYELMVRRLSAVELPVLELNNCAIGDHEHELVFHSAGAMSKILPNEERSNESGVFIAKVKTIDSQLDKFTDLHIHLLKIDVEGHEMAVLHGAQQALAAQRIDMIYIEVGFNINTTQQTYIGDIDSFLQNFGYRVYRIYEQTNEWIEDSPLLRRCNFCYMSSKFAETNPLKLSLKLKELTAELEKLKEKSQPEES